MGATIAMLAATAIQTVGGFVQAGKARRDEQAAMASAEMAFQDADRELQKNYLQKLNIAKEPYEEQTKLLRQIGGDQLSRLQEGDQRGILGGAGVVMSGLQNLSNQQRASMSKETSDLNILKATEDSRLAGARAGLDLDYAKGAQEMAAESRALAAASNQQALEGLAAFTAEGILNAKNIGSGDRNTVNDGVNKFTTLDISSIFDNDDASNSSGGLNG